MRPWVLSGYKVAVCYYKGMSMRTGLGARARGEQKEFHKPGSLLLPCRAGAAPRNTGGLTLPPWLW